MPHPREQLILTTREKLKATYELVWHHTDKHPCTQCPLCDGTPNVDAYWCPVKVYFDPGNPDEAQSPCEWLEDDLPEDVDAFNFTLARRKTRVSLSQVE